MKRLQEAALKPVLKETADSLNPDDLRRTLAQNEYNKMNCSPHSVRRNRCSSRMRHNPSLNPDCLRQLG